MWPAVSACAAAEAHGPLTPVFIEKSDKIRETMYQRAGKIAGSPATLYLKSASFVLHFLAPHKIKCSKSSEVKPWQKEMPPPRADFEKSGFCRIVQQVFQRLVKRDPVHRTGHHDRRQISASCSSTSMDRNPRRNESTDSGTPGCRSRTQACRSGGRSYLCFHTSVLHGRSRSFKITAFQDTDFVHTIGHAQPGTTIPFT